MHQERVILHTRNHNNGIKTQKHYCRDRPDIGKNEFSIAKNQFYFSLVISIS